MSDFEQQDKGLAGPQAGPPTGSGPGPDQVQYLLVLYVCGMTAQSLRAVESMRVLCDEHLSARHRLEIVDIFQQPRLARQGQIVAVPTVVRQSPLPLRRCTGDLSDSRRVLRELGIDPADALPPAPGGEAEEAAEIQNLRQRLTEAEGALRAIGEGEVDVLLLSGTHGDRVFTLSGADQTYRYLVETMNEGAATLSSDGTILYCNNRLSALLQIPLEALIGTQLCPQAAPADRPVFDAQRAGSAPASTGVEMQLVTGTGVLVPVLISRGSSEIPGSSGAVTMVVTDLSQQETNEEIIASEILASCIIDKAGEAIVVCDETGKVIRANWHALQICGTNPLLKPFNTLFRIKVPPDREYFSIHRILKGETLEGIEVELKPGDRPEYNLILTATPLRRVPSRIIGCVVTLADVTEQRRAGEALRHERSRTQSYLDTAETIMVVIEVDGRISTINRKGCEVIGCREEELLGQQWSSTFPQERDAAGAANREFSRLLAGDPEAATHHESPLITREGTCRYIAWHDAVLRDEKGEIIGVLKCGEDITDRKRADEKLHLLARVFEHSGEAIIITASDSTILAVNSTFTRLTGFTPEDAVGQNPRMLHSGKEPREFYLVMWETLSKESYWQGELWNKRKDGTLFPKWLAISAVRNDHGEVINYIGSFTDISERMQAAHRIEHLAHHDPLTNLPNRFSLLGKVSQALELAKRSMSQLSLLVIDLDQFKKINDSLGHHAGDVLLYHVAERLLESVRSIDIVARTGGDEFVVVLQQLHSEIAAAQIACKIQQNVSQAIQLEGHTLHITPSIGISVFPYDGVTVDELMKNADLAMYHAKAKGRNNYQFYKMEMNVDVHERLALESDLLQAIDREEFVLHYQPQIDMGSGRLIGVEALVRWQHPERGLIQPDSFVPIAEETGLILPIGELVLRRACRQMAEWSAQGVPSFRMAVNLSARQFRQENLPHMLEQLIAETGVDPHLLELEITESVAMDNPETTIFHLRRFREMGVELAIDDFGTGYSSLSYLKLFPVNRLKIDRSFIVGLETGSDDSEIAAATIALAHTLGKEVVAEGVETVGQLNFLRGQQCDIVQGYLLSHPLPLDQLTEYLRNDGIVGRYA